MENEIISSIARQRKAKAPNFQELSREELIKYIKENCSPRIQTMSFIRADLTAVQQSYTDALQSAKENRPFVFNLLEGEVIYYPEEDKFEFKPSQVLSNLFKNISIGKSSRLKTLLNARFYKILETAFKLENEEFIKKEKLKNQED